ncbi:MAG: leucine-rich repeat protein [Thermoguttaceae bacterium]|nr:leucine-rich repeat protein [Thermoguttaceae bacterium]
MPTNETNPTPNPASDFDWKVDEETGGVKITGVRNKTANYCVVPAKINGRPVVKIGDRAFAERRELRLIAFGDGLRTIGNEAFSGCAALRSVLFPDGLQTIGDRAFGGCVSLKSVVLPDGLQTLGGWMFCGCKALKSVVFPDGLQTLGVGMFGGCEALESVVLPDGLQTIGFGAFSGCVSLKSVSLPDGLQTIVYGAFSGCNVLTNPNFRSSDSVLFSSDGKTLWRYQSAKSGSYVVPDGVETIAEHAFSGRVTLESVALPDGLQTIGYKAFSDCVSLKSVSLPTSLQTLGERAFSGCDALAQISVSAANPNFRSVDGVLFSGDGKTLYFCPPDKKGAYVVPDGVETLADEAFRGCASLKSVALPDGLQTLDVRVVSGCKALETLVFNSDCVILDGRMEEFNLEWMFPVLKEIVVPAEHPKYRSVDGVLYSADGKILWVYPNGKSDETYVVPEGVELISNLAFGYNKFLKSLTLPASFKDVIGDADAGTTLRSGSALTEFCVAPENPNFFARDGVLFKGRQRDCILCAYPAGKKASSYAIPSFVEVLSCVSFRNCVNLRLVTFPRGKGWEKRRGLCGCDPFEGCDRRLKFSNVGTYLGALYARRFAENCGPADKDVIAPSSKKNARATSVQSRYRFGLYAPSSKKNARASSGRKSAPPRLVWEFDRDGNAVLTAFNDEKATSFEVPERHEGRRVVRIGKRAFAGLRRLKRATFPPTLRVVDDEAFDGCKSLRSLSFGGSELRIGNGAFSGCLALSSASLPASLREIGFEAFWRCESLRRVSFDGAPRSIGDFAFDESASDLTIYAPSGSAAERFARRNGIRFAPRDAKTNASDSK